MSSISNGIRVRHTEYVTGISIANAGFIVDGTVNSSKVIRLALNPGDGETFPWLSQIAPNFEHYTINNITFSYEPTVSQYYVGALLMSPELDPRDEAALQTRTLASYLNKLHSTKSQVAKSAKLSLSLGMFSNKFVRSSHVSTHSHGSLRHYDVGHVDVLLYNIDSSGPSDFGEIKVSYDVVLMHPNLDYTGSKSHHHIATSVSCGGAATYGCPMGDISIATSGDVEYIGNGTQGVRHSYEDGFTMVATATESNRLHFDEPFNGVLNLFTDAIGGTIASVPGLVSSTTWTGTSNATGSFATWDKIKSIGTLANGLASAYKVIANAGDVMDLVWDTVGTYTAANVQLMLTDAASTVVPLMIAI